MLQAQLLARGFALLWSSGGWEGPLGKVTLHACPGLSALFPWTSAPGHCCTQCTKLDAHQSGEGWF